MSNTVSSKSLKFFLIAAWLTIFVSIGHTIAFFFSNQPHMTETVVWEGMKQIHPMAQSNHSLYDFYLGDSYGMGLMYFAFGMLNLFLARYFRKQKLLLPKSIIFICVITSWLSLAIAITWFPLPPILFMIAISLCFTAALLLYPNKQ